MKKITLTLSILTERKLWPSQLSVMLHGVLMELIDTNYANVLHQPSINPYSMSVRSKGKFFEWDINLLTTEAIEQIEPVLMSESFTQFELVGLGNTPCVIFNKSIQALEQSDLANLFYRNDHKSQVEVKFYTPTAFKRDGEYYIFPNVRLVFQSLQNKYNSVFNETTEDSFKIIEQIERDVSIHSFQIRSQAIRIHGNHIPGFMGHIKFNLRGNQTINSYARMLLLFGEYSGVGMKTSLGMGSMRIIERKDG